MISYETCFGAVLGLRRFKAKPKTQDVDIVSTREFSSFGRTTRITVMSIYAEFDVLKRTRALILLGSFEFG